MLVYLDINIVVDFFNPARVQHQVSVDLINNIINNNDQIVISEDMLSTIFYLSNNKHETLKNFQIILDEWMILPFGKDVIKNSINLSLEKNLDLEDVLQCLCAKKNNCDVLITNDRYFYNCGVKIQTASEFLND